MTNICTIRKYYIVAKNEDEYILSAYAQTLCFSFQVNPTFVAQFEERGLNFVGTDVDGQRMEIVELQGMDVNDLLNS